MDALEDGTITAGDVVGDPLRRPQGRTRNAEMLAITAAIKGAGLGKECCC